MIFILLTDFALNAGQFFNQSGPEKAGLDKFLYDNVEIFKGRSGTFVNEENQNPVNTSSCLPV